MRKKKNEIFTAIKEDVLNNAKSYFIVLIIFAVGVFLGVMFINQMQDKGDIEKYINTYSKKDLYDNDRIIVTKIKK